MQVRDEDTAQFSYLSAAPATRIVAPRPASREPFVARDDRRGRTGMLAVGRG